MKKINAILIVLIITSVLMSAFRSQPEVVSEIAEGFRHGKVQQLTSIVVKNDATNNGIETAPKIIDLQNREYNSVVILCKYCVVRNVICRDSWSHCIRIGNWLSAPNPTHHVTLEYFQIYNGTLQGYTTNQWGSCDKIETNVTDVIMRNGVIDKCGGEAIGITGAENVELSNIWIIGGKKANLYIDNSLNVKATNLITDCSDKAYWREPNKRPSDVTLGDEEYEQTNKQSKLGNISYTNNISYNCNPASYWGGEMVVNGLNGFEYKNNTLYNADRLPYIAPGERNANIVLESNQYLKDVNVVVPATPTLLPMTITPITSTVTSVVAVITVTPTRTNTPTPTPTATRTVTPVPTIAVWECTVQPTQFSCKIKP